MSVTERYLVIANVSKRNNVKFLINAAIAYNFKIILVGWLSFNEPVDGLDEGSMIKFETLIELTAFLAERNIPLVGIEIIDGAKSVLDDPFTSSIAVMPGNEGTGLSKTQKAACSGFIYIPQYGDGTASLNVYIATTIILHKFHLWSEA